MTIVDAAVAALAGTCFDPASIRSGRCGDGAVSAQEMACKTAQAAARIWCSKPAALKHVVKCFVAVGAAVPDNDDLRARPPGIPQARWFRFRVLQDRPSQHAADEQQQHLQHAAEESAAKRCLNERQSRVRRCIQTLMEKTSEYRPSISLYDKALILVNLQRKPILRLKNVSR
jgi:hypothetical protein